MTAEGVVSISSSQIGERLGLNSHNVRKDIGYLGDVGTLGAGYDVMRLKQAIAETLGLDVPRNACVVGLGRLGLAILNFDLFAQHGYSIVAGFDSNINKLETMRTEIDVFPSYMIADVVHRRSIELAVLAVPADAAQKVADLLVEGGIRGIVNFTPMVIKAASPDVFISNISILGEFHELAAQMTLHNNSSST